jgi:hypothetical protein
MSARMFSKHALTSFVSVAAQVARKASKDDLSNDAFSTDVGKKKSWQQTKDWRTVCASVKEWDVGKQACEMPKSRSLPLSPRVWFSGNVGGSGGNVGGNVSMPEGRHC